MSSLWGIIKIPESFGCACMMPSGSQGILPLKTFLELVADSNCVVPEWTRKRKCQKAIEQRTKSPWTSQFMTLSPHMEFVYTAWLFWATLWIRTGSLSVENWIGVNVCTREGMTAGEEMLMIFMGNKQDIYLQADRCTWPLGLFSYTRNLGECLSSTEAEMKKHISHEALNYFVLIYFSFPEARTFLLQLILKTCGTK